MKKIVLLGVFFLMSISPVHGDIKNDSVISPKSLSSKTIDFPSFFFLKRSTQVNASLIVLPEARAKGIDKESDPFISFIDRAKKEIVMASYKLQKNKLPQKEMLDALQRAVKRDVAIHLIAEDRLTDMEIIKENNSIQQGDSFKAYQERGVNVHSVCKNYDQSHTKFIIIDRKEAILGNTNFDKDPEGHSQNLRPSRDFAVHLNHPEVIEELYDGFWSDVKGSYFNPTQKNLLWGPKGMREQIYKLIDKAENSICLYQQDMTDSGVLQALIQSLKNGVKVELIMSPHPFGFNKPDKNISNQRDLVDAGGVVYLTNALNIHAKVMIIDDQWMYLGSTNFYQPAIDGTRNVGLLTDDKNLVKQVLTIFEEDKKSSDIILLNQLEVP